MKVYESVHTYIPILYFLLSGVLFGTLYHYDEISAYKPFVILSFVVINSYISMFYLTMLPVTNIVQKNLWKMLTAALFGLILNGVHDDLFRDFKIESLSINCILSILYIALCNVMVYLYKMDRHATYLHVMFMYIPFQTAWKYNLYFYLLFVLSTIYLSQHHNPAQRYFQYLRVNQYFIVFGFVQLFFDYNQKYDDITVLEEIDEMLDHEREKLVEESLTQEKNVYTDSV